jgi:Fic family protein
MKFFSVTQKMKQPEGFFACVPLPFPVAGMFEIPQSVIIKTAEAQRLLGKLDGVTQTIPDIAFFLKMFAWKDAATSSQIEGTRATIADALEMEAGIENGETDAGDILDYLSALNHGMELMSQLPLSLRYIKEIHQVLMQNARTTQFSDPGQFRRSQNWIGGNRPDNAFFVPVPPFEMHQSLSDLEKYMHDESSTLAIIAIAYIHAQFETIHPFLDGNGRTGRLLITFLLIHKRVLEKPVLFLSAYFKKHKKTYYEKLNAYHDGDVFGWLEFFVEGVTQTAHESIAAAQAIRIIRDDDMAKIHALGKRESATSMLILKFLFQSPIVTIKTIAKVTGFSRSGAQKAIEKLRELGILVKQTQEKNYDVKYIYERYLSCFRE